MLKSPKPIKLSTLDIQAPPGVEVMIRLQHPAQRHGGSFAPPVRINDYPASEIERAQDHSELLKRGNVRHDWVTWWRQDGQQVHKWPTLMHGKRRHYRVSVPYRPGVNDQMWRDAISNGAWLRAHEYIHRDIKLDDISVRIDDARNRDEKATPPPTYKEVMALVEKYVWQRQPPGVNGPDPALDAAEAALQAAIKQLTGE